VHLYWDVDENMVYEFLQNNLAYFDELVKYILIFIKK